MNFLFLGVIMKSRKVRFLYLLLFLFCVSVTFFIIFKNNDVSLILDNLGNTDFKFILLAIFCMLVFISGEGINIRRVLLTCGHNVSYLKAFKYAMVGFFFSAITPSSTGGDPAQLFFMSKDNLPVSHSALSLLVELSSFQAVLCLFSFLGLLFNFDLLMNASYSVKFFLFLGMIINIVFLTFLLLIIFSKSTILKIINFVFKLLSKFSSKSGIFYDKVLRQVDDYHNCALYLKSHKLVLFKVFLTTVVQMLFYYSVPFFVYMSLGLHGENFFTFLFLQASLSMAVSYMPMPGTVGASEGVFMLMFKSLFPVNVLSSAMLISRGVSFYLFVVLSGLGILAIFVYDKLCKKSRCKSV